MSSFFYLTGQNIVSALGIYIANDILSQYAGGNWLATVVTIITTGAVIYVAPFGPLITRRARQEARLHRRRHRRHASAPRCSSSAATSTFALVGLFFAGVGMALLNTMTWALEADTVEYGEYKTGIRTEGATYAAFSFIRKVGQAMGAAVAGYALAWAGYDGALKGHRPTAGPRRCWTGCSRRPEHCRPCSSSSRILIMATYPLTEARFREIVQSIQANRARRLAEPQTRA